MALCGRIRIPEESSGMFNPFTVKTPEFWSCQYNGVTTKYTRICGARLSLEENLCAVYGKDGKLEMPMPLGHRGSSVVYRCQVWTFYNVGLWFWVGWKVPMTWLFLLCIRKCLIQILQKATVMGHYVFLKIMWFKKKTWCFREKEVNFLVSENFSSLVVIQTFCHNFSTILHSKPQCTNVSIALHLYIFFVWKNMKLKRIHVNVLSVCVQLMMLCIWRQSIYARWAY